MSRPGASQARRVAAFVRMRNVLEDMKEEMVLLRAWSKAEAEREDEITDLREEDGSKTNVDAT